MYVTHFKGSAVTGQTTGTQRGQTAFVGQFGQRVVLVHELRQRRGTEKFLDSGYNGTNVDQCLRRDRFNILNGHTLLYDLVHT